MQFINFKFIFAVFKKFTGKAIIKQKEVTNIKKLLWLYFLANFNNLGTKMLGKSNASRKIPKKNKSWVNYEAEKGPKNS